MRVLRDRLRLNFEKLEKDLCGDENVSNISMELPRLIVDAFNKLLQLWIGNPKMQSAMKSDELQPIYANLSSKLFSSFGDSRENGTFRSNSSVTSNTNFSYMCDICDEEIPIKNNDFDYSYAMHAQTQGHMEIEKKLDSIGVESETNIATSSESPTKALSAESLFAKSAEPNIVGKDKMAQKTKKRKKKQKEKKQSEIKVEKNIKKTKNKKDFKVNTGRITGSTGEKSLYIPLSKPLSETKSISNTSLDSVWCTDCSSWVPPGLEKDLTANDEEEQRNSTKFLTKTPIIVTASKSTDVPSCFSEFCSFKKARWCSTCDCWVPATTEKQLTDHATGTKHISEEIFKYVFTLNQKFVEVVNKDTYSFLCYQCGLVEIEGLECFIDHCQEDWHVWCCKIIDEGGFD